MGKHYRDYTIGELMDMGLDITIWKHNEKQAETFIKQFEHDGELRETRKFHDERTDEYGITYKPYHLISLHTAGFDLNVSYKYEGEENGTE